MNWKKDGNNNCGWFKSKSCCDKHEPHPHKGLSVRQEIEDFFNGIFDRDNSKHVPSHFDSFQPKVNFSENRNNYTITANLPGAKKEDIKISLNNGFLTISGEINNTEEEEGENFYRVERSFGSFRRQFSLPENIQEHNISSSLNNGVLKIVLPKKEPGTSSYERIIDIEN